MIENQVNFSFSYGNSRKMVFMFLKRSLLKIWFKKSAKCFMKSTKER